MGTIVGRSRGRYEGGVMAFFEIGIFHPKTETNVGTLWRTAYQLGAAGVFTIGRRYKQQPSDIYKTTRHVPLRHFETLEDFLAQRPIDAVLVGIEMGGIPLAQFKHPKQAVYLLGAEDYGLSPKIIARCNRLVTLEAVERPSYNVAVAGSVVLYDRIFGRTNNGK